MEENNNFLSNTLKSPTYVGVYRIGKELSFSFMIKPSLIHRFFSKLLLGWQWIDN
jgi:hypothetical protein